MLAPAHATSGEAPGSRFILSAHDGRTVTDEDFRGSHLLVFFGYTHCPDVCPTSLMTIARVLELLGDQAKSVKALFITVDPARDTHSVLAEFVPYFDPRIIGLTGSQEMIDRVVKGYHAKYTKVPGKTDGSYTIDHTAAIFHMGPNGEYLGRFPFETTPEDIAAKLKASITQ
ncbi:MAG TPA: SCO family protein [Hyphomicrobiaceae bacterium]|nr:SCO family protein [Hyphomicrobiaceae bacterium]